jgi:hypothetical protein
MLLPPILSGFVGLVRVFLPEIVYGFGGLVQPSCGLV